MSQVLQLHAPSVDTIEAFRDSPAARVLITAFLANGEASPVEEYRNAASKQHEAIAVLLNPKEVFASRELSSNYLEQRDLGISIHPYFISQAEGALAYHFSVSKMNSWINGGNVKDQWKMENSLAVNLGLDLPNSYNSLIEIASLYDPKEIPRINAGQGFSIDFDVDPLILTVGNAFGQLARNGFRAAAPWLLAGAVIYDLEFAYGLKFPVTQLEKVAKEIKETLPRLDEVLKIPAISNFIAAAEFFEQVATPESRQIEILNKISTKGFQEKYLIDGVTTQTVVEQPSAKPAPIATPKTPPRSIYTVSPLEELTFSPGDIYVDPFQALLDQSFAPNSRIRQDPKYADAGAWLNRMLQGDQAALERILQTNHGAKFSDFPLVNLVDAVRVDIKNRALSRLVPKNEPLAFGVNANGVSPYETYVKSIRTQGPKVSKLTTMLSRLEDGYTGTGHPLAGYSNLYELRDHAHGLRVYYTFKNGKPLILTAGDKASQDGDIKIAAALKDYLK